MVLVISLWNLAWVILGRYIFTKSRKKVGKVTTNGSAVFGLFLEQNYH